MRKRLLTVVLSLISWSQAAHAQQLQQHAPPPLPPGTGSTQLQQHAPPPRPPASGSLSADQQAILQDHDFYRAKHCVPMLTWSATLAAAAQSWANQCKQNGDVFVHSGVPGENLHWSWPAGSQPAKASVDEWYNEIQSYNFNNPGFSSATGHFTQVVWRSTTQLGCARATCKNDHGENDFWVCRYAPAGNFQGQFPANVPRPCK
jgi:uncharacterized protein YkwD